MFTTRVKELRLKNKLNQQAMADYLGVSRPTYTRYETGEREPDYETLKKLSIYFNTSTDYLLGLSDDPTRK